MVAINPAYLKAPGGGGSKFPLGASPGDVLIWVGPNPGDVAWSGLNSPYAIIGSTFDGASSVLEGGRFVDVPVPYNCIIQEAELLIDPSGTVSIDIYKDSYTNYPPNISDKITSATPPSVIAGIKSKDVTLTGWTTTLLAGDILRFILLGTPLLATKATVALKVLK